MVFLEDSCMKAVAIFRHARTEGPGHFATFLDARRIPWTIIAIDQAQTVPVDPSAFCGLAFMGGPMSVNDPLPWIPPALELIRRAVAADIPVIGHCLGGQLISRALGGVVSRNPVKEIGWGEVAIEPTPAAAHWFGKRSAFSSFHWHGETFTIPPGATRLASSQWCLNQVYALGPHLGMQCHVEMTEQMVRVWARGGWREIADNPVPSVMSAEAMQDDLQARVEALHEVADGLYSRWITGLKP
jgi:GMP synthase-like glutamine amidotransferase